RKDARSHVPLGQQIHKTAQEQASPETPRPGPSEERRVPAPERRPTMQAFLVTKQAQKKRPRGAPTPAPPPAPISATVHRQRGKQREGVGKKKHLSSLKKRIILDRASKWREVVGALPGDLPPPPSSSSSRLVRLLGLVTPDELEDEDEYEEVCANMRELVEGCGAGEGKVKVPRAGEEEAGNVIIEYDSLQAAASAAEALAGRLVAGQPVVAEVVEESEARGVAKVYVRGLVAEEELEEMDEDEEEEVMENVQEMLGKYGSIRGVQLQGHEEGAGVVVVEMGSSAEAAAAVSGLNGLVVCGETLVLEHLQVVSKGKSKADSKAEKACDQEQEEQVSLMLEKAAQAAQTEQVLTVRGEILPSKYKVVASLPKPPSDKGSVRDYISHPPDDELNRLIAAMLGELMAFQERARLANAVKAKKNRRLVFGLREVERGLRQGKIKLLVVANNIEPSAAEDSLDAKVANILAAATAKAVPTVFAHSMRRLGKSLGKTNKVSAVGVYSFDGSDLFKE
ncbi:unnamed protein product, partial [Chrysoparadoxa australica]